MWVCEFAHCPNFSISENILGGKQIILWITFVYWIIRVVPFMFLLMMFRVSSCDIRVIVSSEWETIGNCENYLIGVINMTHLVWECTSMCYVTSAVRHPISIALYLFNLIQSHDLEMIYTHESVLQALRYLVLQNYHDQVII